MLTIKHYNMKRMAGKWLALIGLVAITSCNYLDVVPPATPDFEDTMKDRDATLGFLYSCYAGIPVMYGNWSCRFFGASDEAVLPQIYGYDSQFIQYNQVTTTTNHAAGPWVNAYNTIGQINIFLKYIDILHPTNVSPEDKARWKAECKFLHAYYHHELLRAYGPIPLVTKYIPNSTPKAEFPGRSPYDVCVDSIAKWYDEAANILPATLPSDELGRATSTACKALKARLLLYAASPLWNGSFPYPEWKNDKFSVPGQGKKLVSNTYDATKWQRALDACTEAIDFAETRGQRKLFDIATSETLRRNDGLDLPSYPGLDSIARKHIMQMRYLMCSTEDEGNRETIFGIIIGDKNPVSISVPHGITLNGSGSPIGGWEGLSPTWYTMTHFYTQNGKLPAQDPGYFPQTDWLKSAGQANSNVVKLMAYREPRFYAWLSFDGDIYSQYIANGQPLTVNMRSSDKLAQGYNPSRYQRDNSVTGFLARKYVQPNIKYRQDGGENIRMVPYPIIRLAELYLDRAECYAALGHTVAALEDLNVVRERAGIPALLETDITPDNTLTDMIRNERFIELWHECQRGFDLRRWMIAPDYLNANSYYGLNATEKTDPSFSEFNQLKRIDQPFQWATRMYLLPIHDREVYSDPNLVQSPGY